MNRFRFLALAAVLAAFSLASSASAQNISIVAGNGQAICLGCFGTLNNFFQAMTVKVTDTSGKPLGGQTVTWNTNLGQLAAGANTLTDANGISSNTIFPNIIGANNAFQSYVQYTVNASVTSAASVNFILTQGIPDPFNLLAPSLSIQARNVPVSDTLTGQIGTTSSTKIQLGVVDEHGFPVPNVSLLLANANDGTTGPVANCVSGPGAGTNVVLTDSTGVATCTPIFGGVPGKGSFSVWVGAAYPAGDPTQIPTTPTIYATLPVFINVTPGVAASITAKSGSGQSVNPGQPLAQPLVVEVDSSANQPLAGATVTWTVSPAGAATLSATTTSDVNGQVSNAVTVLGGATGTVTVTAALASDSTKKATFTITVVPLVSITGFQILSGNNQSAPVNTAFPSPLVVQVTTSNGVATNIPVQFLVTSGSVVLSSTTATTDVSGKAQVTVTAGNVTGPASVVATVSSNSGIGNQTFNLTVLQAAPVITGSNFVSGADGQRNSLSPCSLGALVVPANSLGVQPVSPLFPGQAVPSSAAALTINNLNAPILDISNNAAGQQQILFQVPCEVAPAVSVPASLTIGGGTSAGVNITIQAASPGIFQTLMSDGVLRAVIIRPDGSFVSLSNPARRGESVVAMVTGLGPTTPAVATAAVPAPGATAAVNGNVIVGMAGGGVPLNYAQLSPDLPGIYQVSFQIPPDIATGNDISFSIGVIPTGSSTAIYSGTTKIPVR